MTKTARALVLVCACLFALAAQAQVAVISGQAVDQSGAPLPNALIRVCPVTSTGVPCSPLANIFQDYGLTVPAPNPWTSDNFGNYTIYVGPTTNPNLYTVQESPASGITWSYVQNGPFLGAGGGTLYGALFAPDINGEIYPASCGYSTPPSWCSGNTADAWIRAACSQLPATGGIVNLLGLTGTLASPVTCSTPTKQVIMLEDPTSRLNITEIDGATTFPLDNGSMFLGPGAGQCPVGNGIHLSSGSSVTSVVGAAHTDGTQESFTADGLCLWGSNTGGATVTKGMIYAKSVFANTTISHNNVLVCPSACAWVENVGGTVDIHDNWFNVTSGVYSVTGSGLVVTSTGPGTGCGSQSVNVYGNTIEHANGGAGYPEISIVGNGAGAQNCSINVHDNYTEKNVSGTPSVVGIQVTDCLGCNFSNIEGGGGNSTTGDMINVAQTQTLRTQNVQFSNISNVFGSWTNTINDTTIGGSVIPYSTYPLVSTYISQPGYQQPAVLPGSIIQSVGSDAMGGQGSFTTGGSNYGTNFGPTGCNLSVTCTYSRTNSTAPPGYTYSQQVQITANADASAGHNGVQYGTPVSFTAGQLYQASFWAKGDGSFTGFPEFLLWNSLVPTFYCTGTSSQAFQTSWTLYSYVCAPTTTGTSNLTIDARTPSGATGTFWLGGFLFSPIQPLPIGNLLQSIGPYGIGPATTAQQTININSTPCVLGSACTVSSGTTGATGTYANPTSITVANGLTTSVTAGSGATGTYSSPASITTNNGVVTSVTAGSSSLVTKVAILTTGFCTTGTSAFSTCNFTMTWPSAFADTGYAAHCQPFVPSSGGSTATASVYIVSKSTTGMTIQIQNGDTTSAAATTLNELDCTGTHP